MLGQIAYSVVFSVADEGARHGRIDADAATLASLLLLGVPEARAGALADRAR